MVHKILFLKDFNFINYFLLFITIFIQDNKSNYWLFYRIILKENILKLKYVLLIWKINQSMNFNYHFILLYLLLIILYSRQAVL